MGSWKHGDIRLRAVNELSRSFRMPWEDNVKLRDGRAWPHLGGQGDAGGHDDQHDEHVEQGEGDHCVDAAAEGILTEKYNVPLMFQ